MKAALAQMKVLPGQTSRNLDKMIAWIRQYDHLDYDFIAFPELCLGGYLVGDLWYHPDWIREQEEAALALESLLAQEKRDIGVIFGSIRRGEPGERNEDGRPRLYNSAWFYQRNPVTGQVEKSWSDKALLPNYRFFDDKRYFSPGGERSVHPLRCRSGEVQALGLEVCEDMWHDDYPRNPTEELVKAGARIIVNISASPYSYNKRKARDRVIERTLAGVLEAGNLEAFFYVNCVGSQNNGKNILTFDGDSGVYDRFGVQHLGTNDLFKEEVLEYDSSLPTEPFVCSDHPKVELQYMACLEGIRSLDDLMGSTFPYVVGVSGGIDSAVVLCLVERAVGKDRVRAFNLPSQYNSSTTRNNAADLCRELDIPLGIISIQDISDLQVKVLTAAGYPPHGLNAENIQAKTRGTSILSNIAGQLGGVMTNNGNKVEVALGYATLYGDVNGVLAPLGDLLKIEVWDLARYLNQEVYRREVVPSNLILDTESWEIPLPPSAELKENQVDPMKWGYHDALLAYLLNFRRGSVKALVEAYDRSLKDLAEILAGAVDYHLEVSDLLTLIRRYGLENRPAFLQDLDWITSSMSRSVFKRIQAPPIIVQSKAAYGWDVRESQLRWRPGAS